LSPGGSRKRPARPTLVIAEQGDAEGNGKGSGRSIAGVDLGAAIIAARQPPGCSSRAAVTPWPAGSPLRPIRLPRFADWLEERLAREVGAARRGQSLLLDLSLAPGGLTPDLVETLEAAGPFGIGWPGPRIARRVPCGSIKCDLVGADHVRMIAGGS